ncbi:hypothetical protein G4272_24310 (plasmid) [Escherichia coli]|nr:hypothetical protein G4272_24310 [Escherichia coli]
MTAAKADAQQAVDGLQDGPVKTGFSERLDKLDGIKVPAVTDANDDGVADDKAAEVEAKVAAAESAEKAAEDELVKVNQDGVVGKAEAERLTELNAAVTAAKADAPSRRWMVCRMVRSRRASVSVWINWTGSRYRR